MHIIITRATCNHPGSPSGAIRLSYIIVTRDGKCDVVYLHGRIHCRQSVLAFQSPIASTARDSGCCHIYPVPSIGSPGAPPPLILNWDLRTEESNRLHKWIKSNILLTEHGLELD
jgi:hypothetical protein